MLTGSHFNIEYLKKPDPITILVIFTFDPEKERYAADIFLKALEENNLNLNIILNPVFKRMILKIFGLRHHHYLADMLLIKEFQVFPYTNIGNIRFQRCDINCIFDTSVYRNTYYPNIISFMPNLRTDKIQSAGVCKESQRGYQVTSKVLKIAVMGCIVNGPGEMAGADYGYVGAANGKVHIYRGTTPVLKNIPEKDAVKELLKLIEKDQTSSVIELFLLKISLYNFNINPVAKSINLTC